MNHNYSVVIIIVGCCLLFPAGRVCAEDKPVIIDLRGAVARALAAGEALQLSKHETEKNYQYYRQVKSVVYPQLSGTAGLTRNLDYPQGASGMISNYEAGAGLEVTQLIWSFGKVGAAIRAADSILQAGDFAHQSRRQEIIRGAKEAYYAALLAQETLAIAEDSYENARANKRLLEESTRSGRPAKRDLIKIDADIASRVPVVSRARAQYSAALAYLKSLMGIPLEKPVELTGKFPAEYPELDYAAVERKLLFEGPQLKALDKSVQFRDYAAKARKGAFYPDIIGFAGWQKQGASDGWPVRGSDYGDYALAGVKMKVPLWNGGETSARVEQARIDAKNARLERRKTEKELRAALFAAVHEYNEQINTLQANAQALALAKESFALTRDLFGTGQITAADLNDAELLLTGQRLAQMQTVYGLAVVRARIAELTNRGEEDL